MRKVTVMAWCEVDCFLSTIESDFGDIEYVIECAQPVKKDLMVDISNTRKNELYESVDAQLEDENYQDSAYIKMLLLEDQIADILEQDHEN